MRIIYIFLFALLISKNLFSNNIFETSEYELRFSSNNINLVKENKISEIKIKSFQNLIKKILTKKNQKKIKLNDINFINIFILNYKINNEKIINNNYSANIKINFNEKLIIKYLIENKIEFINKVPDKFLVIIMDKNDIKTYLLTDENKYYKYLKQSINDSYSKYLQIPNLDFNDRFIFNEYHFNNDLFKQNNLLNTKYGTDYQILIESIYKKNLVIYDVYLFYNNQKYFVTKIPINNFNYDKLFDNIVLESINKWKEINQIKTSLKNEIECKININNINELRYVRSLLKSNILIQNLTLKAIELNNNLYSIFFIGDIENFKNSLELNRLNLFYYNDLCNIELV